MYVIGYYLSRDSYRPVSLTTLIRLGQLHYLTASGKWRKAKAELKNGSLLTYRVNEETGESEEEPRETLRLLSTSVRVMEVSSRYILDINIYIYPRTHSIFSHSVVYSFSSLLCHILCKTVFNTKLLSFRSP